MRTYYALLLPLLHAVFLAGTTAIPVAADLRQIERSIRREPSYATQSPQYCLLVFGAEAGTRVWLVLDGDTLYVDRNGNGDLTEPEEKIAAPKLQDLAFGRYRRQRLISVGSIREGDRTHEDLVLFQGQLNPEHALGSATPIEKERLQAHLRQNPEGWIYLVTARVDHTPPGTSRRKQARHVTQQAGSDSAGFLHLTHRPADAPVIHFNGPLQLDLMPDQTLSTGNRPVELHARLATPGVGPGSTAVLYYDWVPRRDHPVAEVQFPGEDTPVRVTLTRRC